MKKLGNPLKRILKTTRSWSTKKKILVLIVVWTLIFVPSIAIYTSVHRKTSFAFYPEESSPMDVERKDWDVMTSPNGSQMGDRYVIKVESGEPEYFKWKAKNYSDQVHVGQVNVHYETSWNSSGILRLHHVDDESSGNNETWAEEKTFRRDGEVSYYFRVDKSDLPRFYKRASVITEGGNLYEDVRTGPPPLINFYFIPPTVLAPSVEFGGYFLSFYIYFALFILMDSLLIFHMFKEWDENRAFISSLLFIANPISFYTLFQDEGIIAFTVILSLLLVVKQRKKLGAISIGLGSITKVWSGFLIPAQLFDRDQKFEVRIQHLAISVGTAISFITLFYFLWGPKSLWFISFYGGSASKSTLGGVSIWSTLSSTPLISKTIIDSNIILAFIGLIELGILYIGYKKGWDIMLIFTSNLAFFLIMYPKIHWEYYLMLFPTLLFYAVRDKRIFSIYIGVILSLSFTRGIRAIPSYPAPFTTYSAFIFSTVTFLLIVWMIYIFVTEEKFKKLFKEIEKKRS